MAISLLGQTSQNITYHVMTMVLHDAYLMTSDSEHVLSPTGSESQGPASGHLSPAESLELEVPPASEDCPGDNLEFPAWPQNPGENGGTPISMPHSDSPSPLSQFPVELLTQIFALACDDGGFTGRSLLLVSRAFRAAAMVVALRSLSLTSSRHIFWLHQRLILDPLAKVRVRHLLINLPRLEFDLLRQEPDWALMDGTGSLVWGSDHWEPPDADFVYESGDEGDASSESSSEAGGNELTDLAKDVAFFASEEGQARSGLIYDDEGNVVEGIPRSHIEIGLHLQRAEGFISSSISTIIWATAPVLEILKLQSMASPSPFVFFPHCPALLELDINTPFLIHYDEATPVFPALKRLCIRGGNHQQFIDIDRIIFHAPLLTHLRIPFTEVLLHTLIVALGLFPASATPLSRPACRFEHIERIILAYHHMDRTAVALSRLNGMIPNTWRKTITMRAESAIWSDTYTWGRELSSSNPPSR